MYSVVLATMLAAGGQSTGTFFHGCHGCWGCSGCFGCWGCSGCYGCWGGYSNGCWGCWGCSGCYGCWGGYSYGCWGCSGCYGCYGGYSVVHPTVVYGYSCNGCCGGYIVSGANYHPPQQVQVRVNGGNPDVTPGTDAERDAVRRLLKSLREEKKSNGGGGEESSRRSDSNVARITVRLPASAQMWVDGVYCPLTSNVRSFNTPALQNGTQYQYTLRVQYGQNGQAQEESRRVLVRAGQQVNVDFNNLVSTAGR